MKRIWGHGGEELLAHVGLIFNTVIGWNLEFEMGLLGSKQSYFSMHMGAGYGGVEYEGWRM